MGKTKIKTIDDAAPVEKAQKPTKKLGRPLGFARGRRDELVERLKKELASEEPTKSSADSVIAIPPSGTPRDDKEKKAQKPGKVKPRSKKYQEVTKDLDRTKAYPLNEAVEMVKKLSYSKFNSTLEAHINTAQIGLKGLVSLPFASGKTGYKTESKAPLIHLGLGKLNQPTEELSANIKVLLTTLGRSKIKKVSLCPTQGPSVKVDLSSL